MMNQTSIEIWLHAVVARVGTVSALTEPAAPSMAGAERLLPIAVGAVLPRAVALVAAGRVEMALAQTAPAAPSMAGAERLLPIAVGAVLPRAVALVVAGRVGMVLAQTALAAPSMVGAEPPRPIAAVEVVAQLPLDHLLHCQPGVVQVVAAMCSTADLAAAHTTTTSLVRLVPVKCTTRTMDTLHVRRSIQPFTKPCSNMVPTTL
jgi:hypothetical protein